MPFSISDIIINWVLPLVEAKGEKELTSLLQKLHDTHTASYTKLITGIYPLIDVQLEDYTSTTGNKIDDVIVSKLKKVLEDSAKTNGVTLSNLDAD